MNKREAGAVGGRVRSDEKAKAVRQNLLKAREMRLLYKLNPGLKPTNNGGNIHGYKR